MIPYLQNFAGFLIQTFPCMLLCFLPFKTDFFRIPRKYILIFGSLYAVLTAAIFPLVAGMRYDNTSPASDVFMLFSVLLFSVGFFAAIRAETVKKIIVLFLAVFYASTQYLCVNIISRFFPDNIHVGVYSPLYLSLYAITAAIFFPIVALVMKRVVFDYISEMDMKNIKHEFSIVLTISFLYYVLLIFYCSYPISESTNYWWLIAPPFLFAAVVLCIFYCTLFCESMRRKKDAEQQKAIEIQQLQYDKITQEMENTRRMRHDMRHCLVGLSTMLDQHETEKMKAYLSNLIDNASRHEDKTYCRNQIINGLLQYYIGQAQDNNIRCDVQADCGELPISAVDLTVLIGNAMENAVRACTEVDDNRYIIIRIAVMGGSLAIQITNSCKGVHPSGKYRLDSGFLPSTAFRSSRKNGGYGLGNIEHTAQKNGGDAYFRFDEKDKTFTTRIRLNIHS